MSKFRKIFYIWISLALFTVIFHMSMYYLYVGRVFPKDATIVGDLARMSYSVNILKNKKEELNLEKTHIKFYEYTGEKVEFVTIGDSFSDGAGSGLNPYYQDYIASIYNKSVLDIKVFKNNKNYIESIYSLLNSSKLKDIGVKYVLIESSQRSSLERFTINNINTNLDDINEFLTLISNNKKANKKKRILLLGNIY